MLLEPACFTPPQLHTTVFEGLPACLRSRLGYGAQWGACWAASAAACAAGSRRR